MSTNTRDDMVDRETDVNQDGGGKMDEEGDGGDGSGDTSVA